MTWVAEIKKVSDVDSSGGIRVVFNISDDKDKELYPMMEIYGEPESIVETITRISAELKNKIEVVKLINVGQKIIIN